VYVIANLIGPQLSIVDVVVLVGKVSVNDVVNLLLHERADIVEHCFLLLSRGCHQESINYWRINQYNAFHLTT